MVSAEFFPVLGVNPVAGRLMRPEEDRVGAQPVAVISGGFWKRKFGSAPEAVGKTLTLDGVGYTVVGVIPADFRYQSGNFHTLATCMCRSASGTTPPFATAARPWGWTRWDG